MKKPTRAVIDLHERMCLLLQNEGIRHDWRISKGGSIYIAILVGGKAVANIRVSDHQRPLSNRRLGIGKMFLLGNYEPQYPSPDKPPMKAPEDVLTAVKERLSHRNKADTLTGGNHAFVQTAVEEAYQTMKRRHIVRRAPRKFKRKWENELWQE